MLRTVTIATSKLEDFLTALRETGDTLSKSGGKVVINDKEGSVELEGVVLSLNGTGPYLLKITGSDDKAEDIKYLAEIFSKYKI